MSTYPGRIEGEQRSPRCLGGLFAIRSVPSVLPLVLQPSILPRNAASSFLCCVRLCFGFFFFLDKLENPKVKKNPPETTPSLGRAEIATEELGAAVPGVLGGDLHIRMGVVGFCP